MTLKVKQQLNGQKQLKNEMINLSFFWSGCCCFVFVQCLEDCSKNKGVSELSVNHDEQLVTAPLGVST